jgi:sugar/nucleoside kinase (ribokinase family)
MKRDASKMPPNNENYDRIMVFGEIAKDHIFYINSQKEEILWNIESNKTFFGGMGANVVTGYRLIGTYPYFVTVCPKEFLHNFETVGIRIIQLQIPIRLSEIYNFFFQKAERRTIAIQRGSILTEDIDIERLDINSKVENVNLVHVCPVNVHIALKIPIIYDNSLKVISPALEYQKNILDKIIPGYDIVIFDEREALTYTGKLTLDEAINEFISRYQNKCIVITRGSQGSIGVYMHKVYYQHIINLGYPIVDTMGCGDIFSASFSYYFLKTGRDVKQALKAASLFSGYVASVEGMWLELLGNLDNHIKNLDRSCLKLHI